MSCDNAISDKPLVLAPEIEAEKALKELREKKLDTAVVVGKDNIVQGLFSYASVMKNVLPVSVAMADGIQLDITIKAAPGISKRLKKIYTLSVSDLMEDQFNSVSPETSIWEAVNFLVASPSPLVVLESKSQKFVGMITAQSAMDELQRLQESKA